MIQVLLEFGGVVERASVDEAYVDLTRYSGGLNTELWNTKSFEVRISNGFVLEWSVIAMVPTIFKPNHWKSKQYGCQFVPISNFKTEHNWKTEHH